MQVVVSGQGGWRSWTQKGKEKSTLIIFQILPYYICLCYYFSVSVTHSQITICKMETGTLGFHLMLFHLSSNCLGKCLWVSFLCSPPDAQAVPFSIGTRASVCRVHLSWWAVRLTLCSWAVECLHDTCGALRRTAWWVIRHTQCVCEAWSGSLAHSCSHLPTQLQEMKWAQPSQ